MNFNAIDLDFCNLGLKSLLGYIIKDDKRGVWEGPEKNDIFYERSLTLLKFLLHESESAHYTGVHFPLEMHFSLKAHFTFKMHFAIKAKFWLIEHLVLKVLFTLKVHLQIKWTLY